MKLRKLTDVKSLKNKRVLMRVDFNVPIKEGKVKDLYKIEKTLPTIKYLLKKGAQVILVSHLGRPKGVDKNLSLAPVAVELEKLLDVSVSFINLESFNSNDKNKITLLENIRFYIGEEKNDSKFSKQLSALADIFVLDGFAVAHRDSASVSGVAKFLSAYAGLLVAEEIEGLSKVVEKPKKPLAVIIGGVKCETKIPVINNFLKKANNILVGGGIFSTYLWAKGYKVGGSLVDRDFKKQILKICANKKIILPVDMIVGRKDGTGARIVVVDKKISLTKDEAIYDIGPKTAQLFAKYIKKANTLVMNGALGYFEQSPYQHGTYAISRLFAARSRGQAFGVAGGGETVQILQKLGIMDNVDLVSTGGGAMLEFLAGKKLPGVKILIK